VAAGKDSQTCRGLPASQDRSFSWPGSVEYPPIMSGEGSSCVQCKRMGILGCGSLVVLKRKRFCLQMGLGLCVVEDHSAEFFVHHSSAVERVAVQCEKCSSPRSLQLL